MKRLIAAACLVACLVAGAGALVASAPDAGTMAALSLEDWAEDQPAGWTDSLPLPDLIVWHIAYTYTQAHTALGCCALLLALGAGARHK